MRVCEVASVVSDFATLWTIARQAPLSMGFSRQEYWHGCQTLLQGIFLDLGIEPKTPALAGRFVTTSTTWEAPYGQISLDKF